MPRRVRHDALVQLLGFAARVVQHQAAVQVLELARGEGVRKKGGRGEGGREGGGRISGQAVRARMED